MIAGQLNKTAGTTVAKQLPRFEGQCLVLVQSPLQYLNALEFCHDAKIDTHEAILVVFAKRLDHDRNYEQLFAMVDESLWARVYTVEPLTPDVFLPQSLPAKMLREMAETRSFVATIKAIAADCGQVGLLVSGDYRSRGMQHIFNFHRQCPIVLLDDGSVSHQIIAMRSGGDFARSMTIAKGPKTWRLRWLGGLKHYQPAQVHYFTIYNDTPPEQDIVLRHNYPYWRSQLKAYKANEETWFIGMSHVEAGITSHEKYMNVVTKVIQHYGGAMKYIPHRRDKRSKLETIEALGFSILELSSILEWEMIQRGAGPSCFMTVASTAFDTLPALLPESVRFVAVKPPDEYCTEKMQAHFSAIVQGHYDNPRVETLEL